ncbi:MAG: agmatinase [candidate division WOR-3 bacterium]
MASYFANADFDAAQVVVRGMPLDRSSSYIPGTRFGPAVGRLGTDNIESFSPYQHKDVTQVKIYDAGDLSFTFEALETPGQLIGNWTKEIYQRGKKQMAVGGEHTITPFIIAEMVKFFPEIHIIQFDAHADLRDDFLGERFCHATALSRTIDLTGRERVFQLGIRSFAHPEEMTVRNMFPFDVLSPISQIREVVGDKPVYITLDLDVLDPGVLPDVQTPQPGGCSYQELVRALVRLNGLNIVGADIVEFCPRSITAGVGATLVAELVRELILLLSQS